MDSNTRRFLLLRIFLVKVVSRCTNKMLIMRNYTAMGAESSNIVHLKEDSHAHKAVKNTRGRYTKHKAVINTRRNVQSPTMLI